MENIQLLNEEQIQAILEIAQRDYIESAVSKAISDFKNTDEYKNALALIQPLIDDKNKACKALSDVTNGNDFYNYNDESYIITYFKSKYCLSNRSIIEEIKTDIRIRLLFTQVDTIENIINNVVIPNINVNKYLIKATV
jgi:hypothetical protein